MLIKIWFFYKHDARHCNTKPQIVNNDFYLKFINLQQTKNEYNCSHKEDTMKNKAVKIGIIASIMPHIFCCGIPIALAVAGLIAPESAHFHLVPHEWEPVLFVISGAMLVFSWYLVLRECECRCEHCDGKKSHKTQKIIMGIITVIFVVSVLMHIITH